MCDYPDTDKGIIPAEKGNLILSRYSGKYASLGDTFKNIVTMITSIGKPVFDHVKTICKIIREYIKLRNLTTIHFITIRPSPEFMFLKYKRIPTYKEQLKDMELYLNSNKIKLLSVSVETGTKSKQILHCHIIVEANKKHYKQWKKQTINQVTALHKIYGYQKAFRESEANASTIQKGINYFNGISRNVPNQLKPDVYKHSFNISELKKKCLKKYFL